MDYVSAENYDIFYIFRALYIGKYDIFVIYLHATEGLKMAPLPLGAGPAKWSCLE